jgi:hypothetical protein
LKAEGTEWDTYLRGIEIRNRLTHPKAVEELTVKDEEFNGVLADTWVWATRVFAEVFQSVHDKAKDGPVTPSGPLPGSR